MKRLLSGIVFIFTVLSPYPGWPSAEIGIGASAIFLEPHELTDVSGHAPLINARPCLTVRLSEKMPTAVRWALEPRLSLAIPASNRDEETSFALIAMGDVGFSLRPGLTLLGGFGMLATFITSDGRNLEQAGHFVTPAGTQATWLITTDMGVGYWLDSRLRLDAQALALRVFSASARRWRLLLGLTYVI